MKSLLLMLSRPRAAITFVSLIFLSACLSSTAMLNLVPTYGAIPLLNTVSPSERFAAFSAPITSILGLQHMPAPKVQHSISNISAIAICCVPFVLHFARYAYSFSKIDASLVGSVISTVVLHLLFSEAIKFAHGQVYTAPQRRNDRGEARMNFKVQKTGIICLTSLSVYLLYRICCSFIKAAIAYVISCKPEAYITLANSGASRALMVRYICSLLLIGSSNSKTKLSTWASTIAILALTFYIMPSHASTNAALQTAGYQLIERKESITGYISVIENTRDQFRALRNDHSLLGGQWLVTQERQDQGMTASDSIYSIFYMLEAVRLIEPIDPDATYSAGKGDVEGIYEDAGNIIHNALVVGLGIGTAPSALASHGINTTVVEIDPVVTQFAAKYFALHPNVTNVNQDALIHIEHEVQRLQRYDYIIHDVFTGGAEPEALFSERFLKQLLMLLDQEGTISINYAGDLNSLSTSEILIRIIGIFGNCRVYRDHEAAPDDSGTDLANIVTFCAKYSAPWHFRKPQESEFLGSEARRQALVPKHEVDVTKHMERVEYSSRALIRDRTAEATKAAIEHWRIMRSVLPDAVWENW